MEEEELVAAAALRVVVGGVAAVDVGLSIIFLCCCNLKCLVLYFL